MGSWAPEYVHACARTHVKTRTPWPGLPFHGQTSHTDFSCELKSGRRSGYKISQCDCMYTCSTYELSWLQGEYEDMKKRYKQLLTYIKVSTPMCGCVSVCVCVCDCVTVRADVSLCMTVTVCECEYAS